MKRTIVTVEAMHLIRLMHYPGYAPSQLRRNRSLKIDTDPFTEESTSCIEVVDEDFALRICPGDVSDCFSPVKRFHRHLGLQSDIKFKARGNEERAQELSQEIMDFVIEFREISNPEEYLDRGFDEPEYGVYGEYKEEDDCDGHFL